MILVDSTVWIDYFNGLSTPETDTLDALVGNQPLVIGDLILSEVLQGFRDDPDFETARAALLAFEPVQIGTLELAIKSAQNFRFLRKRGLAVRKTVACLIATYCIETGTDLLHADRDFDPFAQHLGLSVVPCRQS